MKRRSKRGLAAALAIATLGLAGALLIRRGAARRPHLLLVTIDTLRFDRLGCYGHTRAHTPTLDALAARGTRFATAIAHTPLTAPSHASILTGRTPLGHGVRDNGMVMPNASTTLAERLQAAGYRTGAFVSTFVLDRRFGLARGFDTYDDVLPHGDDPGRAASVERRADATTDAVLRWLDAAPAGGTAEETPFFAWVHYYDPHAPYDPPPPWGERFADHPYDGEIAFTDEQLGRLLGRLDQTGRLSRTIVMVTGDHGESLGEHGEATHGIFIYDVTVRVPLLLAGPGVPAGRVASTAARHVDLAPTLLDLAGLEEPGSEGRSLRPAAARELPDEPAYLESLYARRQLGFAPLHGWRASRWKLIQAPQDELYDLASDPGEARNRASSEAGHLASLQRDLERALARPAPAAAIAQDAAERLRALGYLGGGSETATASGRDPKDAVRLIQRVEAGMAATWRDSAAAERELTAALEEEPRLPVALRFRAIARARQGRIEGALADLTVLDTLAPLEADDLVLLGECQRLLGRLDQATVAYERARRLAPTHPDAQRGLADLALFRGDTANAAALYRRILGDRPHDVGAIVKLGVVAVREGRLGEAIELFRRAVGTDPRHPEALLNLAGALAKAGQAGEAVRWFEQAIQAGQRTPVAWNGLAIARLEIGDRAGALAAIRASLESNPAQPAIAQLAEELAGGGMTR